MKNITVYQYPSCSTCKKAVKWLKENEVPVTLVHIVEEHPDAETLKVLIRNSGLPFKKFFNTSGKKYRELGLKDKLPTMTLDDAVALLAADGMLIKRPLLVKDGAVLAGFREAAWTDTLL